MWLNLNMTVIFHGFHLTNLIFFSFQAVIGWGSIQLLAFITFKGLTLYKENTVQMHVQNGMDINHAT